MMTNSTNEDYLIHVDFLKSDLLSLPGKIGLTNVPGKRSAASRTIDKRNLQTDLANLRDHYQIDHLVCLLESQELHELSISDLLAQAQRRRMTAEQFEIPDDGLPSPIQEFASSVERVTKFIAEGQSVVIHCRGGKGRTGLFAACCLVQLGYSPDEAIAWVRKARPGAIEAAIQEDYVRHFAKYIAILN